MYGTEARSQLFILFEERGATMICLMRVRMDSLLTADAAFHALSIAFQLTDLGRWFNVYKRPTYTRPSLLKHRACQATTSRRVVMVSVDGEGADLARHTAPDTRAR
jgi:hypothetical protein